MLLMVSLLKYSVKSSLTNIARNCIGYNVANSLWPMAFSRHFLWTDDWQWIKLTRREHLVIKYS